MNLKLIKKLCSLEKDKLQAMLIQYLKKKGYKDIISSCFYTIAEGDLPICLIAHMDTVFTRLPRTFYYDQEQKVMWSPDGMGADDRAGIYAIINLIERGYRPHIIFTDMEEVGGIGADSLIKRFPECPFEECKALIQLDRKGEDEAVFYQCDNKEFTDLIETYGFYTDLGTFTDISIIAPAWGIAAVNLSIGYEDEHCYTEVLHMDWCHETIDKVEKMLIECGSWLSYSYIPSKTRWTWGPSALWSPKTCCYCGKPIKNSDGHPFHDMELCDECYNEYKDYFYESSESPKDI